ncbi:MAG: GNAT family N-acetyltransferase [Pseudomonadota bacterium]
MLPTRRIDLQDFFGLIDGLEPGWLYHDQCWLTSVRDGFGIEVMALLTEDGRGRVIAATPFMRVRKGPFRVVGSPLRGMYTEFSGPLFAPGLDEEVQCDVLISQHAFLRKEGASYLEWGWKDGAKNDCTVVLSALGYKYAPRQSLVVDIGLGADAVWGRFEGRARNMIRKAEKHGVVAQPVAPGIMDVQDYYEMLTWTFRRQGIHPPHPFSFYQAIYRNLAPKGYLEFIEAKIGDRVVAGGMFLFFGTRMMYLSGTSNEEGARFAANSLVQWEAMKRAIDRGGLEYDMGGTGNARIDRFKESFGGNPVTHHRWIYRTWPVKLAETAYCWARNGWARLRG